MSRKAWAVMSASWGRTCVERTFNLESEAIEYEDKLALQYACPGFLVWTERVTLGRGAEVGDEPEEMSE